MLIILGGGLGYSSLGHIPLRTLGCCFSVSLLQFALGPSYPSLLSTRHACGIYWNFYGLLDVCLNCVYYLIFISYLLLEGK